MLAEEFVNEALAKKIDIIKNAEETLSECKAINDEYHYFLGFSDDIEAQAKNAKRGRLFGLPFSIKDCVCVKGLESRSGSNILRGYKPVFDATVIRKIREEGGIILGKTSQDVFGFGSFSVNVGLNDNIPLNPFDKDRTSGGSSGGAGGIAQKLAKPHIAISESTGGSISSPAAYCGVYGLCPTYGRVSRYGLIDYANSMDKIGVISKEIEDIALAMEIISGSDESDSTSSDVPVPEFTKKGTKKLKIALVKESLGGGVQEGVIRNLKEKLRDIKYELISLPLAFRYSIQTYYLISMSEASTNLSRLCGMRYGVQEDAKGDFNEYFSRIRSKNFEKEAKRRIILGTFARMSGFRDAYYLKALKVRTRIIEEYKSFFKDFDIVITPTMPNVAPRFDEISKMTPLENYMTDIMTAGPNLAGFPHLNIPSGFSDGLPTGILGIADHFEEKKLIDFARVLK